MYAAGADSRKSSFRRFARSLREVRNVASMTAVSVRQLHAGDERVVAQLADREPQTALLADDRTVFVAAFAGDQSWCRRSAAGARRASSRFRATRRTTTTRPTGS